MSVHFLAADCARLSRACNWLHRQQHSTTAASLDALPSAHWHVANVCHLKNVCVCVLPSKCERASGRSKYVKEGPLLLTGDQQCKVNLRAIQLTGTAFTFCSQVVVICTQTHMHFMAKVRIDYLYLSILNSPSAY